MSVITLTTENFDQEVLQATVPVLVDFWASWCGPCRMLSPLVDQVSEEVEGIKVGKVNVDDEPDLAAKYGINSIPTLLVFKNGELADKSVGFIPKDQIAAMVK